MKVFELIQQADLNLLYILNAKLENGYMDKFWLFVTQMHKNKIMLFGVFPALIGWLFFKCGSKAIRPLLAMAVAVAIADTIAYRGIKSVVHRPRPFQNQETQAWLRKIGQAHGPSFPSNHAANCFAGAFILATYFRRRSFLIFAVATLVALSRTMLGVHYPSDVLAGSALGLLIGWLLMTYGFGRWRWFAPFAEQKKRSNRRFEGSDWNWRKRARRFARD